MMWLLFALVFYPFPFSLASSATGAAKPRVAVIGGGIGGASAALFLHDELGPDVEVVVFEKEDRIGGRLKTIRVGDGVYEAGGSIIHPANRLMVNLTHRLGLSPVPSGPSFTFGLYNGNSVVFQTHHYTFFSSIINKFRLLWRYGLDLFRLNKWVTGVLDWYAKIYPAQDEQKRSFASVYEMFRSLSPIFDDLSSVSIDEHLRQRLGLHPLFVDELARIAMRTNYGQETTIPAFVGAVSLAGAGGGLWAVKGGNYRVAEEALKVSGADHRRATVESVSELDGHYHVTSRIESGEESTEDFDAVVLAVPCTTRGCGTIKIASDGVESQMRRFPTKYHRTVANYVKGHVDVSYFGVAEANAANFPDCLYSVADDPLIFNSLCRQVPVDGGKSSRPTDYNVWKLFTHYPLTMHHVDRLFVNHSAFHHEDWLAYPEYDEIPDSVEPSLPSFIMDNTGGLVSINAVEKTASAMEQSAIAAKNAALLVARFLRNNRR